MHLRKCCSLRSLWRTTVSFFYLHGDVITTHISLLPWEKQASVWRSEWTFRGGEGSKPCSGLGPPFAGNVGEKPKLHTQATSFHSSLFSSSFLTHLQSFLLTPPFGLCWLVGVWYFTNPFASINSLPPTPRKTERKAFYDERNGSLKKLTGVPR